MVATTLDGVILKGVFASRPAASAVAKGAVYHSTDTKVIYQSDGSSWSTAFDGSSIFADPMTTRGDIIVRNSSNATARLAVGSANTVFKSDGTDPAWGAVTEAMQTTADNTTANVTSTKHGYAPKSPADATQFLNGAATAAFAAVKDSDLSTSDVTTNNASTSKHGFLKKLSNAATDYMDGSGNWSVPAGGGGGGGSDLVQVTSGYGSIIIPGLEGDGRRQPASPNGADQEFDAALSGGTTLGSPTTMTAHTTRPSHLYIKRSSTTTSVTGYYYSWTPSNGDTWTVLQNWFRGGGNSRSGLFIGVDPPGKMISIGKAQENTGPPGYVSNVSVDIWTNPTTFGSQPANAGIDFSPREPVFLRIVYNSSTSIDYQYSYDGYVWFTLLAANNPSATIGVVGLMVEPESADVYSVFDYLRKNWTP